MNDSSNVTRAHKAVHVPTLHESRAIRCMYFLLPIIAFIWICIVTGQIWCNTLERDEGYLNAAASLVAHGKMPYIDFIFPQQPYYPLIYGLLFKINSPSLLTARILSGVFYGCLVALVALFMLKQRHDRQQAFWAVIFMAFNTLGLFWYTKAKHYISADMFMFAAFLLVIDACSRRSERRILNWRLILAGACAAVAVQIRLLLAPGMVLLAAAVVVIQHPRLNWKALAGMGIGAAATALPNLLLFCLAPDAWLFNNFTLQLATRPVVDLHLVLRSMAAALWGAVKLPENAFLLALCIAGIRLKAGSAEVNAGERLALLMVLVLSLAFLVPAPTYRQYWVETIPYLVVAATRPWCRLLTARTNRRTSDSWVLTGMVVLVMLVGGYRAVGRMMNSQHWHPRWGLGYYLQFKDYMAAVNERNGNGEIRRVLTWWPGYLVADGLLPYPGSELGRPCYRAIGRFSL
jgi:hypothetical protein